MRLIFSAALACLLAVPLPGKDPLRWRLEDIYASESAWLADLGKAREDLAELTTRFREWTSSPAHMLAFLEGQAALNVRAGKLGAYAQLQGQVHLGDAHLADMGRQAQQVELDMAGRFASQRAELMALGEQKLAAYQVQEPRLKAFAVTFRRLLMDREHLLPEAAERLVSRMDGFADGARQAGEVLDGRELPYAPAVLPDGRQVPAGGGAWRRLAESRLPGERRAAAKAWADSYRKAEQTFATLADTAVRRDVFEAQARKYADAIAAQMAPNEIDRGVHDRMLEAIRANLAPYHRYLKVRQRMLGLPEFHAYDRDLQARPPLHFTFEETRRAVEAASARLGVEYGRLARHAFDAGWMDVLPREGKAGLGSASCVPGVHPYILLNFEGSFFDADTVAHELGHALQFQLAADHQPVAAADPAWFTTEIPSQVAELLFIREMLRTARDDDRKISLLWEFLDRLQLTLVDCARQAAFKQALYAHVEEGGSLSADWMNAKNLELRRAFAGHDRGVMLVDDFEQHVWGHRDLFSATSLRGFTFAFNAAVALAFTHRIEDEGDPAIQRYLTFLKAGSSKPAMQLLREAGVDVATPAPFEAAMRSFDRLLGELEALLAKKAGRR